MTKHWVKRLKYIMQIKKSIKVVINFQLCFKMNNKIDKIWSSKGQEDTNSTDNAIFSMPITHLNTKSENAHNVCAV